MSRQKKFIHLALQTAALSEHPRFRLGAVLVQGSRVVALGVNKISTHPRAINSYTNQHGISIHAELSVLLRAGAERASGSTLYVARITRAGIPCLACPCERCQALALESGVKRIWYTGESGEATLFKK